MNWCDVQYWVGRSGATGGVLGLGSWGFSELGTYVFVAVGLEGELGLVGGFIFQRVTHV